MLPPVMVGGLSLDRHEPPDICGVEGDARRSSSRARSVWRVEAIDVPEHRLREVLRKRLALNDAAADLTVPFG
jgi:hypothetical protein